MTLWQRHAELLESVQQEVERVEGIEPSSEAWEATVLPLNYTRLTPLLSGLRFAARLCTRTLQR